MILDYTAKNVKVAIRLLTSRNNLTNKPISACVRMPCDSLVTTGLLQFDCQTSPADRGTKKHVYLPYRGAIPFWFYLIPLKLVSIFLNVVRTEICCGLLPNLFCRYYYETVLLSKKVIFKVQF